MHNKDFSVTFENGIIVIGTILYFMLSLNIQVFSIGKGYIHLRAQVIPASPEPR